MTAYIDTKPKKMMCSIYIKIGCESFPNNPWYDEKDEALYPVSGKEIYDFLMSDCESTYPCEEDLPKDIDPSEHRLEGDKIIWYLGCNEKHGNIELGKKEWKWGWGESSFDTIKDFVDELLTQEMINHDQYNKLIKEIKFANDTFVLHYDISDYLRHKKYGISYNPNKSAKIESKAYHANVNDKLEKKGYKIYTPNVNW